MSTDMLELEIIRGLQHRGEIPSSNMNEESPSEVSENEHEVSENEQNCFCISVSLIYVCLVTFAVALLFLGLYMQYEALSVYTEPCDCLINKDFPLAKATYAVLNKYTEIQCTKDASLNCTQKCEQACKEMCTSLALQSPVLYRKIICDNEPYAYRYLGFLFYRPCGHSIWKPLNQKMEVCCLEGVDYNCRPDFGFP